MANSIFLLMRYNNFTVSVETYFLKGWFLRYGTVVSDSEKSQIWGWNLIFQIFQIIFNLILNQNP